MRSLQIVDLRPFPGNLQGLLREFHGRHLSTVAGEVDRVRPNATADFEHFLALPPRELSEAEDVRLDEVLARLHLVEVLPRADRFGRMANVARTLVPELLDFFDQSLWGRFRIKQPRALVKLSGSSGFPEA